MIFDIRYGLTTLAVFVKINCGMLEIDSKSHISHNQINIVIYTGNFVVSSLFKPFFPISGLCLVSCDSFKEN